MPDVRCHGATFHVDARGDGPPLILLHGFTGSSRSWASLHDDLARSHRAIAIDLIGHGKTDSPAAGARYAFMQALDDLSCICGSLGIEAAAWLGYSMGGRVALGLAVTYPHLVSSLILESASPGIPDACDRSKRRKSDSELAGRIMRSGIPSFVSEWERLPMWSSQSTIPDSVRRRLRETRLSNSAVGLAGSLRGMGAGAQPSFWDDLGAIRAPVLIIAGALDAKYAEIGARMRRAIPRAELAIIPDAGHAVHLEQPGAYVERIIDFLARSSGILA